MRALSRAALAAVLVVAFAASPAAADPSAGPSGDLSGGLSSDPAAPCDTPVTHRVAQVQGAGDATPLAGRTVRVEGVVTADFQRSDQLSGFFLQDPRPDSDPLTSEGLFAYARDTFKDVNVGDRVLVTGRAVEYNGWTELSPVTAVDVCGTGSVAAQPYRLPSDGLEPVENMLLTFPQPLTVSDHYNLGRYGEVTLSSQGRLFQPTDRPGVDAARNARRSLLVDDGSNRENPAVLPPIVRGGDVARGVTGVLGYGFGKYRLQPTEPIDYKDANPRPPRPFPVIGNVKVASFNTLNWFTTLGSRGAGNAEEQRRQLAKLVAALKGIDADAVALMEVENNGQTALQALVDAVNAEVGAGTYAALAHPYPGTDAIQVGLIYKPARLTPVGAPAASEDPVFSRPPLIQTFRRAGGGQPFTLLVNHLKSKGSCPSGGPDADQGDGQSCWNPTRVAQAKALLGLIEERDLPGPIVLGDLNAYGEEDPIGTLEAGGLTSVTKRFVPAHLRYSYLFDGLAGELDHAMVGRQLLKRVTSATIWHINADEPRVRDYNLEYNPPGLYRPDAYRSSDHDPLVIGLTLPGGR
ncbi:ExeM/NucH family extracellular endonuclease [Nonomuraea candida]|uniref:ExeM/NucH family extracellular endonuclease n=1 Tax=Nonomuraea candida TaxID=359159 RepID=UPI0005B907E3|nr:ExeM/NucH family extracellular endonuclease [Nonomuraea candida]